MPLLTCECMPGATPSIGQKLDAIYCAIYSGITDTSGLIACECIGEKPLSEKLDAIYCALLQLIAET